MTTTKMTLAELEEFYDKTPRIQCSNEWCAEFVVGKQGRWGNKSDIGKQCPNCVARAQQNQMAPNKIGILSAVAVSTLHPDRV